MKEEQDKISLNDKIVNFVSNNIVWVFLGFIIIVIILPRLFIGTSRIGFLDNLKPNEIGDAIGGMTAPIIGLFSALLVYLAFREQKKANDELIKFNEKQVGFNEMNELKLLEELILSELNNIIFYEFYRIEGLPPKIEKIGREPIIYFFNPKMNFLDEKKCAIDAYLEIQPYRNLAIANLSFLSEKTKNYYETVNQYIKILKESNINKTQKEFLYNRIKRLHFIEISDIENIKPEFKILPDNLEKNKLFNENLINLLLQIKKTNQTFNSFKLNNKSQLINHK